MAFSPDGKTLAGGGHSEVWLWDATTGQLKITLEGHTAWVVFVVFSPDGHTLASASQDRTVRLWDVATGQLRIILEGPTISVGLSGPTILVGPLAFSPDGHILAGGNENGTILLWDMSPYITSSAPTAIQFSSPLPTQTALLANFPNPFNPDTYIPYQLHAPAHVRLSIYDVRGALVREINVGYRAAGQYLTSTRAAHWDGRDHRGERVASGVYLYRLQAGPVAHVRKMVLIK
ncbi:MAG: T9SS type A sorting domain-containing protein [Gemmatimonadetes bacterium]|nr:T9SS type A sorting domain-containing protein [Gemmatimonadota bacterium]